MNIFVVHAGQSLVLQQIGGINWIKLWFHANIQESTKNAILAFGKSFTSLSIYGWDILVSIKKCYLMKTNVYMPLDVNVVPWKCTLKNQK